jgi:arylsulfatase
VLTFLGFNSYARAFQRSADQLLELARRVYENAGPEYQSEVLSALPANPFNGPFHRLDEELDRARVVEKDDFAKIGADAGIIFRFEFDDSDAISLAPATDISKWRIGDGLLSAKQTAVDDYVTNRELLDIPRDQVGSIFVRARSAQTASLLLAWSKEAEPEQRLKYRVAIDLIGDDEFHTYQINASNALKFGLQSGDSIRRLFLSPSSDRTIISVEIDYIRFVSKLAKYSREPRGVGYETIDREMRRVLYMLPSQTLQYPIRVPEQSPVLEFGTGILMDQTPITFEVTIHPAEGEPVQLHHSTADDGRSWRETRIDLARWAGQEAKLHLRVAGASGNVALWSNPRISSPPKKRFNVILILEDTLRADHLSSYGYERGTSPVKKRLIDEGGVLFRHAISQATKTRPSVPALMTSLLPSATGVWLFHDMLPDSYLTLAEVMRSQGYLTASFIQNPQAGPLAGLHQGFSVSGGPEWVGEQTEDILGGRVLKWLEANRNRNFFLYLHIMDPHGVYDPPQPFDAWYHSLSENDRRIVDKDGYLDPEWIDQPSIESRTLLYDGEILHNDSVLSDFLAELESMDLMEDTLLILTSDHGEYLGEAGLWSHGPPGRLHVTGVPLMLHYPERFAQPEKIDEVVQLIDVMPTILELAGVESDEVVGHGTSLVDLIERRRPEFWANRITVSEEPTSWLKHAPPCPCGSLFFRNWQLLSSTGLTGVPRIHTEARAFEFTKQLEGSRPSLSPLQNYLAWLETRRVLRELQSIDAGTRERFWTQHSDDTLLVDPEGVERLRALGYIN